MEAAQRLGMSPSDYLAGAPSHLLLWSVTETPVGDVIAVATSQGLAALSGGRSAPSLPIDVHGTVFQARVWSALRDIPPGQTRTYSDVARSIGRPTSVRAVARACAANPVALAIPCHRVIRSDGSLTGYRWGIAVKESLLASEHA